MNFQEYEREGQKLYRRFSKIVSDILYSMINSESGYRLQIVKFRAKDTDSLHKKLKDRSLLDSDDIENEIKDLAGCRIIFYTNTDVNKFISSGLIFSNFEIIDAKIHHPVVDSDNQAELYISNHFVVSLKEYRTILPEYQAFKNLRCEIQIQTILNHAWAEMAHDTIYKIPNLDNFGLKEFDGIKNRLGKVAKKYLVPAGYEFQKISSDFQRLIEGKKLFDNDALIEIITAQNNNIRVQALEAFLENVLPFYDDVGSIYPEIVSKLLTAAIKAYETATIPIETPYGNIPGKTYKNVLENITNIITRYSNCDLDVAFSGLCNLSGAIQDQDELDLIVDSCKVISKHNINTWRSQGAIVQNILINHIDHLSDENKYENLIPVVTVLGEILGTEITGTTSDSSTITFHRSAVTPSPALKTIRTKAIDFLKVLYRIATHENHRNAIMVSLRKATITPYGGYSNELLLMVLESTEEVLEFYLEITPDLSYEVLQSLEDEVHHFYWRYHTLPDSMHDELGIVNAATEVRKLALLIRDKINSDQDYVIYKTLVGFNSIFPPAWEDNSFQYEEIEAYRGAQVDIFLKSINDGNAEAWLHKINRCASTKSNDGMTFKVFGDFLEKLAILHPEIVFSYFNNLNDPWSYFLPQFLNGLMQSKEIRKAYDLQLSWISKGEQLEHISWYLQYSDFFEEIFLSKALDSAIIHNNKVALCNIISVAGRRFDRHPGNLISNIFLPAILFLTKLKDYSWLQRSRFSWLDNSLIKALNEGESTTLLNVLIEYPKFEENAEYIAASIAERWPLSVIEFIGKRLEFAENARENPRYEALPFELRQLKSPLSTVPVEIIEAARLWFYRYPHHFEFVGARLIASVFPELSNGIYALLESEIAKGSQNFEFVLNVLSVFEGEKCIYELVRSIISSVEPESDLLELTSSVLNKSGVVRGDFGFVEMAKERKVWILEWLPTENPTISSFVNNRVKELEYDIAAETRRAETSIAIRKLSYGEEI
jgi:ppGpp synthetase/RelA/SpoT-type nucleotidyltranferase